MAGKLRHYDGTEPALTWLEHAHHHGIPVLIPCTLHGTPCLASGVLELRKGKLADLTTLDDNARALLATVTAQRVTNAARRHGAETL